MNMEIINKIETQISELEGRLKRNNDLIGNLVMSIKNLSKEKAKSHDESNAISGAIQAFKGVLAEVKESDKEAVSYVEEQAKNSYEQPSKKSEKGK